MDTNIDIKKKFKNNFTKLLDSNLSLKFLFHEIFVYGTAYVVGGYLRDFINGKKSRDLDIIIDLDHLSLKDIIKESKIDYEINRHQGIKLKFNNLDIDLWSFESNWAFKNQLVKLNEEDKLNSIAKGCFYNYDSLVINLHNFSYNIRYYNEFQKEKKLDILQKSSIYKNLNPTIEANIIRALYLKYKFNIALTDNTIGYLLSKFGILRDNYQDESLRLLKIKKNYPKYDELTSDQLCDMIKEIKENKIIIDNQLYLDI